MFDALRDLLPYIAFLVGVFYWGMLLGPLLDDHTTQIMYIVAASAAFSRMAITLIHDTLTHLTVPMLQPELLLPICGILVATNAPEHNVDFIMATCALSSVCWLQVREKSCIHNL